MSQNFEIGPSSNSMSKTVIHDYFSRFHKIKTRVQITNLRHGSLYINVL